MAQVEHAERRNVAQLQSKLPFHGGCDIQPTEPHMVDGALFFVVAKVALMAVIRLSLAAYFTTAATCLLLVPGCGPEFEDFGVRRPDGGGTVPGTDAAGVVDTGPTRTGDRYHPDGYATEVGHSADTMLQREDCRICHGTDLRGGTFLGVAVDGCDNCHNPFDPMWRTTCTFCHGGLENMTGSPPKGIGSMSVFMSHSAHGDTTTHAGSDCGACHTKPVDVLSPGHSFDDTPGRSEVNMAASLSPAATYAISGTCTNSYCHGNGRTPGTVSETEAPLTCGGCHAGLNALAGLSGQHTLHALARVPCGDCHSSVVNAAGTVIGPALHVNGTLEYVMAGTGITESGGCTGFCHGKGHFFDGW